MTTPTHPTVERHRNFDSDPAPQFGAETLVEGRCPSGAELFGRVFSFRFRAQLSADACILLRDVELYGSLLRIPSEVQPPSTRGPFMFDEQSHDRNMVVDTD